MDSPLSSARRVLPKALSALMRDGALELWAARKNLGAETDALVRELRYAQAMVNTTRGRETDNPSLDALLLKVRLLANDAAAVLGELDCFRVQDELDGAADVGCALHGLLLLARRTARDVAAKLKPSSGSGSRGTIIRGEHDERDSSSKPLPTNQDDQKINAKSMQMLASITRNSARGVRN